MLSVQVRGIATLRRSHQDRHLPRVLLIKQVNSAYFAGFLHVFAARAASGAEFPRKSTEFADNSGANGEGT